MFRQKLLSRLDLPIEKPNKMWKRMKTPRGSKLLFTTSLFGKFNTLQPQETLMGHVNQYPKGIG